METVREAHLRFSVLRRKRRTLVPCLLYLCPALLLLEQQTMLGALAMLCCALQLVCAKVQLTNHCFNYVNHLRWTIRVYRRLPLNALSRLWGRCHRVPLPPFARGPAYRLYSRLCACNLAEADCEDLRQFRNLSEFFRRSLKPQVRPICPDSRLVSPADGTVLHFGRVTQGHLEQVKGITYTLQGFLGPRPLEGGGDEAAPVPDAEYHDRLKHNPQHELHHCVIYLSPGDYHRFHSPTDWTVQKRRHFPGHLLSVSPRVANMIRGLFCINERAVYLGSWRHGFFSYTAVGATNVGSISVFKDEELRTNQGGATSGASYHDREFDSGSFAASKGELFGEFNLGSTIVLLFEAPKGFRFALEAGQKIQFGQSLGQV